MNSKLIDGFQEAGLKQYINPDKKPDFHTNYLRQLSLLDRLEFIKFVKKIDNDLELHNTNNLNKFTVVSFDENIKIEGNSVTYYQGVNKMVRSNTTIPTNIDLFYFEILIESEGENNKIGIGIAGQSHDLNGMPGKKKIIY